MLLCRTRSLPRDRLSESIEKIFEEEHPQGVKESWIDRHVELGVSSIWLVNWLLIDGVYNLVYEGVLQSCLKVRPETRVVLDVLTRTSPLVLDDWSSLIEAYYPSFPGVSNDHCGFQKGTDPA